MNTTSNPIDSNRGHKPTDLRLRILGYHLAMIARLQVGQPGSTLHTVEGMSTHVCRTDEGNWAIDGEIFPSLDSALYRFVDIVDQHATGLHADND